MGPDRDSSKHGPRLDEELKSEVGSLTRGSPVESRAEEDRVHEPPSDEERNPSAHTARPGRLGPDDASARAELSRHLRRTALPADSEELLEEARTNAAPEAVLAALERLPAEARFETVDDVWDALGGEIEHVAGRPDRNHEGPS